MRSWFLVVSYRDIRPFKPSNLIPGAIVPNHTVRALATPYSAVYGVSLSSTRGVGRPDGVPWCGHCPLVPGGVLPPGGAWGSGVPPTVGRGG